MALACTYSALLYVETIAGAVCVMGVQINTIGPLLVVKELRSRGLLGKGSLVANVTSKVGRCAPQSVISSILHPASKGCSYVGHDQLSQTAAGADLFLVSTAAVLKTTVAVGAIHTEHLVSDICTHADMPTRCNAMQLVQTNDAESGGRYRGHYQAQTIE